MIPTVKNRESRRKYGLTLIEIESFLKTIQEKDLFKGPEIDRDFPNDEIFIFKKRIIKGVNFYIKVKKDTTVSYDRIKILSCHEDENQEEIAVKCEENIKIRKIITEVKGQKVEFDEYYLIDENGNEIFDRDIEIENDKRLYDVYKKQNNLLTISEIKKIRNKYDLNQKEYAQVIGVGEITIHRFENGSIQTESVDSIMKLSNNPSNMEFLMIQNKKNMTDELYEKIFKKVGELIKLQAHAIIKFDKKDFEGLKFITKDAKSIARDLIVVYNQQIEEKVKKYGIIPEYIKNLKLQKLLYYVQAYALLIFERKAFNEKIIAWSYGPVVEEVYH